MPEYIIRWNCGFGDNYEIIQADNEEKANEIAYESWKDDAEANADYGVVGPATDELLEDYGL